MEATHQQANFAAFNHDYRFFGGAGGASYDI